MLINILEYLESTAARVPDKIALEDRSSSLSFAQLRTRALDISDALAGAVSDIRSPVAVFLPKGVEAISAFMGVLYSGNIYMPMDVKSPAVRTRAIFENIEPAAAITDESGLEKISGLLPPEKIIVIGGVAHAESPKTRWRENIDTDPAYIINTSGSTGVPKGVAVSHRSIIDYIEWARDCYGIGGDRVMGNQAPLYFDNSVLDIYLCLSTGLKLILTPEELFTFPIKLLEYFSQKGVDTVFFVPSVLSTIANLGLLDAVRPPLKTVLFAGETMPTKQLNYWISKYPEALFSNLYGPTEITVDCTYFIVDRPLSDAEPVPIGRPCRNADVIILDSDNRRVEGPGKSGEICVRGTSLALGYYNNPARTEAAFVQNPLNSKYPEKIYRTGDMAHFNDRGEIIFEGRKDLQIKHMGFRIELGEIESAARSLPGVDLACAVFDAGKPAIILFYEAREEIPPRSFASSLASSLPKYMIPAKFVRLDAIPLTANGKTDRAALAGMI